MATLEEMYRQQLLYGSLGQMQGLSQAQMLQPRQAPTPQPPKELPEESNNLLLLLED